MTVGPELPTPVPAGRKKNKAERKKMEKGKGKAETEGEAAVEAEAEVEEEKVEERDPLAWKDGFTTGLAIIKLMVVGSREDGGVIVLASG